METLTRLHVDTSPARSWWARLVRWLCGDGHALIRHCARCHHVLRADADLAAARPYVGYRMVVCYGAPRCAPRTVVWS
jgi:hypothetical protein